MKKYNLLIPMAGLGKRFLDAGYKVPKQFIYVT
jgi:UTP-glucose-1-phosphate uridylyltransferase